MFIILKEKQKHELIPVKAYDVQPV